MDSDNHIIRVIIQGYDRLSNVVKQAADKSASSLENLNKKVRENRDATGKTASSQQGLAKNINALSSNSDTARNKLDRLSESIRKLREASRTKIFVADDIVRGFKKGLDVSGVSKDEIAQRLKDAKNAEQIERTNLTRRRTELINELVNRRQQLRRALEQQLADAKEAREAELADFIKNKNEESKASADFYERLKVQSDQDLKNFEAASKAKNNAEKQAIADRIAARNAEIKDQEAKDKAELARIDKNNKEKVRQFKEAQKVAFAEDTTDLQAAAASRSKKQEKIDEKAAAQALLNERKQEDRAAAEAEERRLAKNLQAIAKRRAAALAALAEEKSAENSVDEERLAKIREEEKAEIGAAREVSRQRLAAAREDDNQFRAQNRESIKAEEQEHIKSNKRINQAALQEFDRGTERRIERLRRIIDVAKRQIVEAPSASTVRQEFENERTANINAIPGAVERQAARVGRAIDDLNRGFQGGKKGLAEFEGEMGRSQRTMARFGAELGKARRDINNFINVRWSFVIGIIATLGTVLVQLGVALVAVASSAILAGAALGGALIAGAGEALPVIGLLAAAFQRLQAAMKVVQIRQQERDQQANTNKINEQQRTSAVEGLADAHYNLTQALQGVKDSELSLRDAHEAVADAERSQVQAVKDLADARRQASRDLVDSTIAVRESAISLQQSQESLISAKQALADFHTNQGREAVEQNLKERDAVLSLQEAEFGVLDAKKKLADFLKAQRQNNQDIKDAQANVKEAQQRLEQARAEGNAAEIANAQAQLDVAQTAVSDIKSKADTARQSQKELEEGVKRAQLTRDQTKVRNQQQAQDDARDRRREVDQLKTLELAVKSQQLAVQQARIAEKRAREDDQRLQKKGVEGSDQVVQAQERVRQANRQVRDSIEGVAAAQRQNASALHAVMIAQRSLRDSQKNLQDTLDQTSAKQRQSAIEWGKLSKAEQAFVLAVEDFKVKYKKAIGPISDIIVEAATRGVKRLGTLFDDPKILSSLQTLAGEIAAIGDNFTKWVVSPQGRATIKFFIDEAVKNLPGIARAAGDIAKAFVNIGEAAAPILEHLIYGRDGKGGIQGLADRFAKWSENRKTLDDFFKTAETHLDAWLALTGAIGRFFGILIGDAAKTGKENVQGITDALNGWSDWMEQHSDEVKKFFDDLRAQLVQDLIPALTKLTVALFKAFTSSEFTAFANFVTTVVIPALLNVVTILGYLAKALQFFENLPVIGKFITWAATIATTYFLLSKLLPVTKLFAEVIVKDLIPAIFAAARALTIFLVSNPWIAIIAGAILLIVALDQKFHFLRPTVEALGRVFKSVFNWIKDNWKLIPALIVAPLAGVVALVITKFRDPIINVFKSIISWVREHWKDIVLALTAIFLFPGGAIAVAIYKWHDQMIKVFQSIIDWFKNNWKTIATIILAIFTFPAGLIALGIVKWKNQIIGVFKGLVTGIVNEMKKLPGQILDLFKGLPKQIEDLFKDVGKNIAKNIVKSIPGGQQVLDAAEKAADIAGKGKDIVSGGVGAAGHAIGGLFHHATGGEVKDIGTHPMFKNFIRGTDRIAAMLTPGEWILNKEQQEKLAKWMGYGTEKVKNFLFGNRTSAEGYYAEGGVVGRAARKVKGAVYRPVSEDDPIAPNPLSKWWLAALPFGPVAVAATGAGLGELIQKLLTSSNIKLVPFKEAYTDKDLVGRFKEAYTPVDTTGKFREGYTLSQLLGQFREGYTLSDIVGKFKEGYSTNEIVGGKKISLQATNPIGRLGQFADDVPDERKLLRKPPLRRWRNPPGLLQRVDENGKPIPTPPGRTALGTDTTLFGDLGELALARMGGRVLNADTRTGSFDVGFGSHIMEVKTVSRFGGEYKARISTPAAQRKEDAIRKSRKKAATGILIVDNETGLAELYWREGIGSYRLSPSAQSRRNWNYGGSVAFSKDHLPQNINYVDRKPNALDVLAYEDGGVVRGKLGQAINAIVHAGEWVLNPQQQAKVAQVLGQSRESIRNMLFGPTSGDEPTFTSEGPDLYKSAYKQNRKYALPGPYNTALNNKDEKAFRAWLKSAGVTAWTGYRGSGITDYDYRGFWKEHGGLTELNGKLVPWRPGLHFPDTWKTPYDTTFSRQSRYSSKNNPFDWDSKDRLVNVHTGKIVFEDIGSSPFTRISSRAARTLKSRGIQATLHAGEWVLNQVQQSSLAKRLKMSTQAVAEFLFGAPNRAPNPRTTKSVTPAGPYEVHVDTDDDQNDVYFVKLRNGLWGQVSKKDGEHIIASNGSWLPGYVKQNEGLTAPRIYQTLARSFATGGVITNLNQKIKNSPLTTNAPVAMNALKRAYASGGVVSFSSPSASTGGFAKSGAIGKPVVSTPKPGGNTINQHFEVKTEGDSDWNHIMRLGAQHATEGY